MLRLSLGAFKKNRVQALPVEEAKIWAVPYAKRRAREGCQAKCSMKSGLIPKEVSWAVRAQSFSNPKIIAFRSRAQSF